jgi:hypothetical protein
MGLRGKLPSTTGSEKIVTSENGTSGDGCVQFGGNDEEGGIKQGTVGGGVQHGTVEEDDGVDFLPPTSPVEGIVRVFRRLGCKNDVCIFARAVLQSKGDIGLCGFIVQQNRPGDVGKFMV